MAAQPVRDAMTGRRWSAPFAVAVGLAYVLWRAADTLAGVTAWLAITALVVEVAGVAGTAALLIALRRPRRSAVDVAAAGDEVGPIDVVVRFDGQSVGNLHATLAGVRHMFDVRRVAVITDRVDVATNAVRGTPVAVLAADRDDPTRLRTAAEFGEAPFVAVFDAGDVPQPGFTGVVRGAFVDDGIGVAQGCLVPDGVDSAEHDARGRHELRFEREVLNPSLGARGAAVFLGSGALVRRSVLQSVKVPRGARRSAELRWSIRVRAAGHALVAPPRPIVSAVSINTEGAVSAERRRAVRAALATLVSPQDPVWNFRLRARHGVGYLAWMVRPLSGLRRVAFVATLVACLITTRSPVRPQSSAWVLAGLWAGWFVLQGWAVARCSEGRLRPGDRSRWSLQTMGASVAALFGAGRRPVGDSIDAARAGGWRSVSRNPFLVAALLSVAAASVAIGIDRWRSFLPEWGTADDAAGNPAWTRAAAAAVAVWTVALMLDVVRCLVGGPQLRAAQRLRVRLDATVDDQPARLTSVSPRGAGVVFDHEPDLIVGDQVAVRFLVPAGSGTTAEVATIATVRSIRPEDTRSGGVLACGVEFGAMDRVSADALFAYCAVVHPEMAVPIDEEVPGELVAGSVSQQRSLGVRLLGATALLGIGAAMMPPYGVTTAAQLPTEQTITVRLIDGEGGIANTGIANTGIANTGIANTGIANTGIEGATVVATCVGSARVIDDRDRVLDLARAAIQRTRTQQRASRLAAAAQATDRNVRRENIPSKQAAQQRDWNERSDQVVGDSTDPIGVGGDPASMGWHRVPSVEMTEADPIVASDQGDGTYVITGVHGSPCRVEAVELPAGYAAAPMGSRNGSLVQFVDAGGAVSMMARRPDLDVAGATDTLVEIGNRVWLDADGDGLQDPAEPGLEGVPVTLTIAGAEHRVTTAPDGTYRFSNDPTGPTGTGVESGIEALQVGATMQIGVPLSVQPGVGPGAGSLHVTVPSTAPGSGPAIDPATGVVTFTMGAPGGSAVYHDVDVGYTQTNALGDRVWLDADNDGRRGPGEQGIDGVTVLLYVDAAADGLPDGDPVDAQVTSQGGLYAFAGLPPGSYVVEVHPPDGMVSSTGAIGRADGPYEPNPDERIDDDDDGVMLESGVIRSPSITIGDAPSPTGEPTAVDTSAGAAMAGVPDVRGDATIDFGLFPSRAIDDAVWFDENGDGRLSPDEPGVPGVPLVLMRGEDVLAITISDAEGDFVFPNVTLGDYTVQVHAPAGLHPIGTLPALTDDGELPTLADEGDTSDTTGTQPDTGAGTGQDTATTIDPSLDALDGVVDGVFSGVVEPSSGQAAPVPDSVDPANEANPEATIEPTAPVPADDPPFEVVGVTVAPDWAGPDAGRALQRFGLWAPRSIGHVVWEDADDDGTLDPGELPIPGVSVRLLEDDRVVARTLSAIDGTYRFVDLPDGTYRVAVDVPDSWRTSSVAWDDPSVPNRDIDHGLAPRGTGRVMSSPIRIGRVAVDAAGSFDRADIGLFQPRPTVTVAASLRACTTPTTTAPTTTPSTTTTSTTSTTTTTTTAPTTTTSTTTAPTTTTMAPSSTSTPAATTVPATVPATGSTAGPTSTTTPAAPTTTVPPGPHGTCIGTASTEASPLVTTGSMATWSYLVSNTGNVPVSGLEVTDDRTGADSIDCNGRGEGTGQPLLLDVGRSVTCTTTAVIGSGAGRRTVTVHASGESSPGNVAPLDPVEDTVTWFGSASGLALRTLVVVTSPGPDADGDGVLDAGAVTHFEAVDDADRPGGADTSANHVVAEGTTVWWVDEVHNTGSTALADVSVVDQQRGRVCGPLELAPGERRFCVASTSLTVAASDHGQVRALATATATALPPGLGGGDPAARVPVGPVSDAANVYVGAPALQLAAVVHSAAGSAAPGVAPVTLAAGEHVDVSYTVTNTGDVAFGRVELTVARADEEAVVVDCPELSVGRGGLEPGESVRCTGQQPVDAPPPVGGASPATSPTVVYVRAQGEQVAVEGAAPEPVVDETSWSYRVSTLEVAGAAFLDVDGDAVRDDGEPPMPGIEVHLLDDRQQDPIATTTTDADGAWRFGSLGAGRYSAEYVVPDGFMVGVATPSGVRIVEPVGAGRTIVTDEALIDGVAEPPAWQLALVRPMSFGEEVWFDTDADGRHDADERGAVQVPVLLSDARGDTVARTTTDGQGRWSFAGVARGEYEVTVQTPSGPVTAAGATPVGIGSLARIDDRVWDDVEGDGWLSAGERGMPGVIVTLIDATAAAARVLASTTTDNVGRFTFTNVPAGEYVVALGAVPDGAPVSMLTSPQTPSQPAASAVSAPPTLQTGSVPVGPPPVRAGGSAAMVAVDGSTSVEPELSLSVSPDTLARFAPGRGVPDEPSLLDPSDLVPTSLAEVVEAIVFVISLVVFSVVAGTARRRRLR